VPDDQKIAEMKLDEFRLLFSSSSIEREIVFVLRILRILRCGLDRWVRRLVLNENRKFKKNCFLMTFSSDRIFFRSWKSQSGTRNKRKETFFTSFLNCSKFL
jgi:hypothetical protein